VPGLGTLLEGLLPYTHRHFARADRLLRSTYLCDYILAASGVLTDAQADAQQRGNAAGDAQPAAEAEAGQEDAPRKRQRPVRALLGPPRSAAAANGSAEQQQEDGGGHEKGDLAAAPGGTTAASTQPAADSAKPAQRSAGSTKKKKRSAAR
jgi:U3 small nucleolar RNA-associated protein 13